MKYKCKECGIEDTANSIEDIITYKKLCTRCLSKHNRALLRKTDLKKTNKKQKKKMVYICNNCGHIHNTTYKPYDCDKCFTFSFTNRRDSF